MATKKDPMLLELGKYLRTLREGRGVSQEELAARCGLHRTYLGSIERGEYNLTLRSLRRITDALGISLADAMGSISQRRPRRRR